MNQKELDKILKEQPDVVHWFNSQGHLCLLGWKK